jgi:small-conductance mechanosensitive channel
LRASALEQAAKSEAAAIDARLVAASADIQQVQARRRAELNEQHQAAIEAQRKELETLMEEIRARHAVTNGTQF